jgi:DNA-binding transcriptional ArsR family regulator
MSADLATTANLLGDPGRSAIMLSLMGGVALPAGELAVIANVSPQTASGHLGKLVAGRLLSVEHQGRHRYYRLSSAEVADAIEALLVVTAGTRGPNHEPSPCKAKAGSIGYARTCYSHLAGWLGVRIAQALEERVLLIPAGAGAYAVTPAGRDWFEGLGIKVQSQDKAEKKFARRCLDWTERRHHLAGALGCGMYKRFTELGWIVPIRGTRAVRLTLKGKSRLWDLLRISER